MRMKAIFIVATIVLFGGVCAKSDALARGSGGEKGVHGSTMSGWHGLAGHGMHRMNSAHFPFKGPHGMHSPGSNQHRHMMAQGQWHSMHGHNGVWHRNWQAGGGAFVGDICLNSQNCQGVWQVMPRTSGAAAQSRRVKKDWQVDGEL